MKWPHTVTLWSRSDGETYTRRVLDGALWVDSRGAQLRRTGETPANGVAVYLPLRDGLTIRPDDFLARGAVDADVQTARELNALGALRIRAADTLDFGGLPHWEVTCE